jgi:hypothetical protein
MGNRMRRIAVAAVFLAGVTGLHGQNTFTIAGGADASLNTRAGVTGGPYLYGQYDITPRIAAGLRLGMDFSSDINAFNAAALLRLYLPKQDPDAVIETYLQAGVGGSLLFMHLVDAANNPPIDENATALSPLFELGLGTRIHLSGSWFIEAQVRGGYPFIIGAGLMLGTSVPPYTAPKPQAVEDVQWEDDGSAAEGSAGNAPYGTGGTSGDYSDYGGYSGEELYDTVN